MSGVSGGFPTFVFMSRISTALWLLAACLPAFAQPSDLFDQTAVHSIRVEMNPADVQDMYANFQNKPPYLARFIYDTGSRRDTVDSVEIRFRGNTSLNAQKKSFSLKFNEYRSGVKYQGVEELNLIGSHNDPSMVRQKLYYDLWNDFGMPQRRSSFVRLYLNGDYYGLYTNLEEMDDLFCQRNFGNRTGPLFKCIWGADLTVKGTSGSDYKFGSPERVYQLKTQKDRDYYDDLARFIAVLNQTPAADFACAIEKVFDVDGFLRAYALDVCTGHWDNYGFNKNNFYLYRDPYSGRFAWIPYDTDNTFGINWIGGENWTTRDVMNWSSGTRPLVTKLMAVPQFQERYKAYVRYLVENPLHPDSITSRATAMRSLIATAAQEDTYRTLDYGFTYQNFWDAFTVNNIVGHAPYGIVPFATARRTTALQQLGSSNTGPALGAEKRWTGLPDATQPLAFSVMAKDNSSVQSVVIQVSTDSSSFVGQAMSSLGGDRYGVNVSVSPTASRVWYYFTATDNGGKQARYPSCGSLRLTLIPSASPLRINEVLAINNGVVVDNFGEASDFAELYNTSTTPEPLTNRYLSDDPSRPEKWPLAPGFVLPGHAFALCWMDDDEAQGTWHGSFNLDGSDSFLRLYGAASDFYPLIDSIHILGATANISFSRVPDGTGDWAATQAVTPLAANQLTNEDPRALEWKGLVVLQNPVRESLRLRWMESFHPDTLRLYDASGRVVNTQSGLSRRNSLQLSLDDLPQGWYMAELASDTAVLRAPFVWMP